MKFENVKRVLASSLVLAGAGVGCGNVDGVEPPINATSAGTVDEGGTLAMSGTLVTADKDSGADKLVYTVESLPAHGALMRGTTALAVSDSFTQKEVNDGKISYVNDGEEQTSDEFTWSLSDGPNEIPATPFAITITPVNDLPKVDKNTTGELAEGGNIVLSADQLSVSDAETAGPLTFTLGSVVHGTLQQKVADGPFADIAAGATFTQQDLADGNLKFIDSGVDDANLAASQSTEASFSWSVADADGGVTEGVTKFTVMPQDDAPVIAWKPSACYVKNTTIGINPVMSFTDVDTPASAYQICVASIYGGTHSDCSSGTTCVTSTIMPTIKNGAATLVVGSCLAVTATSNVTLLNTASDSGGGIGWQLKKGATNVGAVAAVGVTTCP